MSWMYVAFSKEDVDSGLPVRLTETISFAYRYRSPPRQPVLFRTTGLSGQFQYFVSPEAASLAAEALSAVGARECAAPDESSLVPVLLNVKPQGHTP